MRIRNTLLAIVIALLLVNLGVMLSPVVRAVPKTQYKAVKLPDTGSPNALGLLTQRVLDDQSAQAWEYVGTVHDVLIFKK
jgi:hypothetical protein